MMKVKIQSHADLRKEMKAVASGKQAAPKDEGKTRKGILRTLRIATLDGYMP